MGNAARTCAAQFKNFVDLFLIFCDGRNDFDFAEEMLKFFERSTRIGRHRVSPEQRDRKHALI